MMPHNLGQAVKVKPVSAAAAPAAASRFVLHGGRPIDGELMVRGMKNAATPILAATLLVSGPSIIRNVPRIADVERMLDILRSLGAAVDWVEDHVLRIDTRMADIASINAKAVKSMRSSILLLGPLLSRFHQVELPEPGGCIIGNRPIDDHLSVLEGLGAKIETGGGLYRLAADTLKGNTILPVFSVTATENAVMAAVRAKGRTVVKLAAAEPHVEDLIAFLNAAGAKIAGAGTHTLVIDGVDALKGVEHTIIPDQIEVGTFAVIGAVTKGTLRIRGIAREHLDIILLMLRRAGVQYSIEKDALVLSSQSSLRSFRLQAMPYPGFPTDLQSPFGVLATQSSGTSLIHDPLYEGRLGYINELIKMGANATICDPHRVLISGPTPLYGQEIRGLDLRAGATLIIAGLLAQGETIIHGAEVIDRGYESLDSRLTAVGADITRVSE